MRTTINHALDLLEQGIQSGSEDHAELTRVLRRVQADYSEIIENALSLLVQRKTEECTSYLREERNKLDDTKERIGNMIAGDERWHTEHDRSDHDRSDYDRLVIEYLFTRARLVDELRLFPGMALGLLERLSLDQSLAETITYLENAMTGKKALFDALMSYDKPTE